MTRARPRWLASLASAVLLAAAPLSANAQMTATEAELKAAFLYNFARYVRWPDKSTGAPFRLCTYRADGMAQQLQGAVAGKQVESDPIEVQTVNEVSAMEQCRILFVGACEQEDQGRILTALSNRSVLTVSDNEDFAVRGGIVQFRRDENRLRLDINLNQAEAAQLKISSQLLKLARIVPAAPTP